MDNEENNLTSGEDFGIIPAERHACDKMADWLKETYESEDDGHGKNTLTLQVHRHAGKITDAYLSSISGDWEEHFRSD